MKEFKIKTWMFEKIEEKSRAYHCYIDVYSRDENGAINPDDEFQTVRGEILGETEKAIKAKLHTGDVVESVSGWTCWIPKSCVQL